MGVMPSCYWEVRDFGGGKSPNCQHPSHQDAASETYIASLAASNDSGGHTRAFLELITVPGSKIMTIGVSGRIGLGLLVRRQQRRMAPVRFG